jgi:VanZ family protein
MRPQLEPRYSLLTLAYLLAIYLLSSIPDVTGSESDPWVLLLFNLGHIPLFAGLAFCVLRSLSPARAAAWARYGLAFVACGVCGALDEWHQSFVPGRDCSLGDFLLDLAGIAVMLVLLRLHELRREERRAGAIARLGGLDPSTWPSKVAHAARKK